VSACALCDSPLVDHPPASAEPTDHSLGSVEIRGLGPDQRSRLELVLESSGIPFELGGVELRFPESRRPDVELALDELGNDDAFDPSEFGVVDPGSGSSSVVELGTTARRVAAELVGAVLWGAALTAGGVLADRLGVAVNVGSLAGFLVITLVNVTLVSRIGADPGKSCSDCGSSMTTIDGPPGVRRCSVPSCCSVPTGVSDWS
jgi:hypothetical protein